MSIPADSGPKKAQNFLIPDVARMGMYLTL
jgi:hypothetical protein